VEPTLPKGPTATERDLIAILLKITLASTAVFLQLAWGQAMLFAANKPGASVLTGFGLVFMVAVPLVLQWRGRLRTAVWFFLASSTFLASVLYWLGRDVFSVSTVVELGVIIHAAILLGRRGAYSIAAVCLGADLVKLILQSNGWMSPLYFPGTSFGSWGLVAVTVVWVAPPLIYVVSKLHRSTEELRVQVEELRQANEKLRKSEQLVRAIAETAPVGIVVFNAEGKSVFANGFAVARLGEEIRTIYRDKIPWPVTDFNGTPIPVEERPFARMTSGDFSVYGARIVVERPPGRKIYMSVSAAPLQNGSRVSGVVIAFEDVTAHVDSDRRHVQSQRLASMGELAGWVAHDFNNFLTVIRGDSQLALEQAPDGGGLRTRLQRIYQTSDRAAAVCKRLLTFARRDDAIAQPLSLTALVNENAEMLRGLVPSNVKLDLKLEKDLRQISGDASLLTQVLMNLVVNAKDAMPDGGTVTITTSNDSPRSGVLLLVEDGGAGINLATLPSIFEPRFTTKPEGRGTGLGLAIVYGIVDQFGGWVRVESEPGQGTRFLIRFPAVEAANKSSAA
jgi:signal transduction histidine kinase